jgi:HNH endonuclease
LRIRCHWRWQTLVSGSDPVLLAEAGSLPESHTNQPCMNPVHRVDEQTARIELTQSYTTLVDQASLWLLLPYQWCVHQVGGKLYARTQRGGQVIYMHRLLLKAPTDSRLVVDHQNGDGLDNKRSNLRLITRRQKTRPFAATAVKRSASTRSRKSRRKRHGRRRLSWPQRGSVPT